MNIPVTTVHCFQRGVMGYFIVLSVTCSIKYLEQFQKSRLNTEIKKFLREVHNYWPSAASNGRPFSEYDSNKFFFLCPFSAGKIIFMQTISCIHCKIESTDNDVANIHQRNDRVVVQLNSFNFYLYMSETDLAVETMGLYSVLIFLQWLVKILGGK